MRYLKISCAEKTWATLPQSRTCSLHTSLPVLWMLIAQFELEAAAPFGPLNSASTRRLFSGLCYMYNGGYVSAWPGATNFCSFVRPLLRGLVSSDIYVRFLSRANILDLWDIVSSLFCICDISSMANNLDGSGGNRNGRLRRTWKETILTCGRSITGQSRMDSELTLL